MDTQSCPTNESKTLPLLPLEGSAEVKLHQLNERLRASMVGLVEGRRKGKGSNKSPTAGDRAIPILIEAGCRYDGTHFIWPWGKKTKPNLNRYGYHRIAKNIGTKERPKGLNFSLARFICWQTHGAPPIGKPWADHKNRIRHDDRPENLHWVTAQENIHNVAPSAWVNRRKNFDKFLNKTAAEKRLIGTTTKMTTDKVTEIRTLYATGQIPSTQLAAMFGLGRSNVLRIIRGHTWKDVPMVCPLVPKPVSPRHYWPLELQALWDARLQPQTLPP